MKKQKTLCYSWHYRLTVTWWDNRETVSNHEIHNEAEGMAIDVLTASGQPKCGRVKSLQIDEIIGVVPNQNPHGI